MKKSVKKGWNIVLTIMFYSFLVMAVPSFAGDEYQITAILQSPAPSFSGYHSVENSIITTFFNKHTRA